MIRLDYVEEGLYEMRFQIGCEKNSFCAPAYDKYIDCSYEFHVLSENKEIKDYYNNQNKEFCKCVDAILSLVCNWKMLLFHSADGAYISIERSLGFQRYCLILDILLNLKKEFRADKPLITSDLLRQKDELEKLLGSPLEIVDNDEEYLVFTHGNFREDPSIMAERQLDNDLLSNPLCAF